jgi:hypothetical protein
MGIRQIKAALQRIENEGGDTRRLILAVPVKRGVFDRDEAIRTIARHWLTNEAEARKMLKGARVGVLVRAESYNSHPSRASTVAADLALLGDGVYQHAGEIVYPSHDDLRWSEAKIIDDNAELFDLDRLDDAVDGILYGSDRRGGLYYESGSRRY